MEEGGLLFDFGTRGVVRETEGVVVSLRGCADGGRDVEQAEQDDTGFRKDGGGARWHYPHVWTMVRCW